MGDIKWSIIALASQYNMSIEEFANSCGISPNHLKMVSAGNVKMWADDMVKIHNFTGIPMENIKTNYQE